MTERSSFSFPLMQKKQKIKPDPDSYRDQNLKIQKLFLSI
ncbi:hypothetical protein HJ01_00302 [Flavobacterium frigoris PS1]|uniref:Uncharacterized protein n=1 Tax=Flavobacterium frigoris (strain PS1) TaxID=1086011 RepID=H7FMJ5_FLAFP|nr:hypothetical protein HJ01_00302 [Flavobacterium frigoris PS1]